MKVLVILVLVCTTSSIFAQSKKDQIAALTLRLDSLSREYVKDTAQLNHTVESLERKNSVLSGQHKAAQEQNKKKSQAIRDKTETIKTLNASNMELMQERKEMQNEINSLNDTIRMLNYQQSKPTPIYSWINSWDVFNQKKLYEEYFANEGSNLVASACYVERKKVFLVFVVAADVDVAVIADI